MTAGSTSGASVASQANDPCAPRFTSLKNAVETDNETRALVGENDTGYSRYYDTYLRCHAESRFASGRRGSFRSYA